MWGRGPARQQPVTAGQVLGETGTAALASNTTSVIECAADFVIMSRSAAPVLKGVTHLYKGRREG